MVDIAPMSKSSLTEKYRLEKGSPCLSPRMGDSFYSRAYSDLVDSHVDEIANCVKEERDIPDEVRTDLRKTRLLLNDVKFMRAGKIATDSLRASWSEVLRPGKSTEDTYMLSRDPRGNEMELYNALRKAFDDFMYDE